MYQNGKTALAYVSGEIDASIKDIDEAIKNGFPGCPPEGVRFHMAIGRATKAQLMWQGVQVEHAIEADHDHKRRQSDACKVPFMSADTLLGKFKLSGAGAVKFGTIAIVVIAIGGAAVTTITTLRRVNQMAEQLQENNAMIQKNGFVSRSQEASMKRVETAVNEEMRK